MKRLLPVQGKYARLASGLKLHYLDTGEGEAVVMLHGNPSWCFYYRNLAVAMASTHRVIVPDHIGCGLSDKPDDSRYTYTLEQRVADLEELLESSGVEHNITLVVHDWGGMIGMAFATRHPQKIKKIVAMNTAAFHMPQSKKLPLALKIGRNSRLGTALIQGLNAFSSAAAWIGCKQNPMPRALRQCYTAPYNSWRNRIATLRFVQDIPLSPADRAYPCVTAVEESLHSLQDLPLMVCWGEKDFVFDHHFLEQWRLKFPHARFHTWAQGGHYILEDVAAEIIPLICAFIREP
ncbi:MAG: alpha/beta fold hydrolase [Desulfuromonas sp.]